MVSHINLQNFQSIKGPVQIDFAPITLLYGPNSAGKSAVFDAIRIDGELCNEDPDWNMEAQIEAQLPSFMHMHDFAQTMVIGVGATITFEWLYPPSALGSFQLSDFFPSLAEFVYGTTDEDPICRWDVRFVIAFGFSKWEDQGNSVKPYVDTKAVEISESGKKLVRLDLERGSIEIDLSHRLVRTINRYLALDGKSLRGLCADVIAEPNLLVSESVLSIWGGEFDLDMARIPPDHLWQSFNHPYSAEKIASRSRHELEILLQYLIFSPIRGVGAAARMVNRIGPLRLIPKPEELQFFLSVHKHGGMERWSAAPVSGRVGVWEDGSVAWTKLAANCEVAVVKKECANGQTSFTNRLLVDAVNDWLSEPERLGLDSSIGITTRDVVCGSSLMEQE